MNNTNSQKKWLKPETGLTYPYVFGTPEFESNHEMLQGVSGFQKLYKNFGQFNLVYLLRKINLYLF